MRVPALALFALLLIVPPAEAQKVYVDYDPEFDFSRIEKFSWTETTETSLEQTDPLMHSRVVNGIEHYLSMSGIVEVKSAPDIYVTYHTSTEENLSLDTASFGYGYPGRWYGGYYRRYGYGPGWGVGATKTTVTKYETGTLVVDAWDARTEKLVWRGIATNITISDNPGKMAKRLDRALEKIVRKWQKLKKKMR